MDLFHVDSIRIDLIIDNPLNQFGRSVIRSRNDLHGYGKNFLEESN